MTEVIVGLDIGTSSVRVVIGEIIEQKELLIVGLGSAPSTGLRNGQIVNIEATMKSIKAAIEAAEFMAGHTVFSCITSIGGSQIESLLSRGSVGITTKNGGNREVNGDDIARVIDSAKALNIPLDREILHVVPRNYSVDDQTEIKDPTNILGFRLEVEVCILTASKTAASNVAQCINRAGYNYDLMFLKTLAASEATISDEEKDLGSILIDLGGGTTDVLVISEGRALHAISLPIGGNVVTNDISAMRAISFDTAEKIKKNSGCCWYPLIDGDEEVIIPGIGGNSPQIMSRQELCDIIQPRVEEIFTLIRKRLPAHVKSTRLSGSVVLAGGGALMPGIVELAIKEFQTNNVKIAQPSNFGGPVETYRNPEYATAIGLLVSNLDRGTKGSSDKPIKINKEKNKFFEAVGGFFKEFF